MGVTVTEEYGRGVEGQEVGESLLQHRHCKDKNRSAGGLGA